VLVVRVAGDEEALQTLARRAEAAGRRCGVPVPERAYRPHVTLARARGESADMSALVTAFTGFATEPWMARRLLLYRSHLGPVPRHEQLAEWPFASS
jgi:2'-5' RNA ligase